MSERVIYAMAAEVLHDLECASAAYAALIEKAELGYGKHSQEAKRLRREWRDYLKRNSP